MASKKLRAVSAPAPVLNVSEATDAGDRIGMLEAMARRIAESIDDERTLARDLAALTKRLADISREIEAAKAEGGDVEVSSVDFDADFNAEAI